MAQVLGAGLGNVQIKVNFLISIRKSISNENWIPGHFTPDVMATRWTLALTGCNREMQQSAAQSYRKLLSRAGSSSWHPPSAPFSKNANLQVFKESTSGTVTKLVLFLRLHSHSFLPRDAAREVIPPHLAWEKLLCWASYSTCVGQRPNTVKTA